MIIGNNTPNNFNMNNNRINRENNNLRQNNMFSNKMNQINSNNEYNKNFNNNTNVFTENINSMQHSDPSSSRNMKDKAIAMLHERLENGTITMDEFSKSLNNLNKK